jgi:hypothetical protein
MSVVKSICVGTKSRCYQILFTFLILDGADYNVNIQLNFYLFLKVEVMAFSKHHVLKLATLYFHH